MADWNAREYLGFAAERTRPARDLALRARDVLGDRAHACPDILDLGCGPGNSTAVLAQVFPSAGLTGLDSSPEMIRTARASGLPARWLLADAGAWETDRPLDLVFSNAVLQWLPDPDGLVGRMAGWLSPGGVLAIQVPGNGRSPLHLAVVMEAGDAAWQGCFDSLAGEPRYQEPESWLTALEDPGLEAEVWESTYWHVLGSQTDLIRWYAATGLRPWLECLADPADQERFKARVLERARPAYPVRPDGRVLFPFRRIFCVGRKA